MIEVTSTLSPATACATLPHTFVDATTVSVPSPVVSEPHAVRVRAAANDSPTAAVAARKPEEARTEIS